MTRCPCRSGETYDVCCARLHAGAAAPSAETLMRARFSAFALGDEAYLRRSWHRTTRPKGPLLDPDRRWLYLEIVDVSGGGPLEQHGVVEFRAHYRGPDGRGEIHERSTFVRERGEWYYLQGAPG